ncbi:hypothetical protein GWK47_014262 [Chionoecetes opilio]|uniref:Uncharacterized protein n=1 Tax=Chionoecetes opilio TaxID=41210 RepID=A0A8J4XX69_CHIOP|nr:hypothetical protein GWK47_014262 [Chionoecetes opilio]
MNGFQGCQHRWRRPDSPPEGRDDGGCKHIVAFILAVADFIRRCAELFCTGKPCTWDKPRKQGSSNEKLEDIEYSLAQERATHALEAEIASVSHQLSDGEVLLLRAPLHENFNMLMFMKGNMLQNLV